MIDLENIKGKKPNDNDVKTVLKLLHTDILESIFYKTDESNVKIYDKLKSKGKIDNKSGLIERFTKSRVKETDNKDIYENVLGAMSFVVIKINVLRKIANLDENECHLLNNLKIYVRLVNINERLKMIKRKMGELEGIKEMVR